MDIFLCAEPAVGSVTQIVTAGAAVVAAGTGVYGVVNAVRSYRASIESQVRQAENERRDQARYVHPEIRDWSFIHAGSLYMPGLHGPVPPEYLAPDATPGDKVFNTAMLEIEVVLSNDSQEVISNISLGIRDDDETPAFGLAHGSLRYVLPKTDPTVHMVIPWPMGDLPDQTWWRATAFFTDARGNVWTRETGMPVLDFSGSH